MRPAATDMQITLKLYASLGRYLPDGAQGNTTIVDVAQGTTVQELIDQLQLPRELTHLVLINGVFLEPEKRGDTALQSNDAFAIWPPIAGG